MAHEPHSSEIRASGLVLSSSLSSGSAFGMQRLRTALRSLNQVRSTLRASFALAALSLMLFGAQSAMAQATVSGRVTDAQTGEGIPGVNVVLVELATGAATDVDGNYRIPNVRPGTYTLQATFIGYSRYSESITVGTQNQTVNIQLTGGAINLDDVVVTGYGLETRAEVTAASSQIGGEEIRRLPVRTADAAIQGRASGVQITSSSGAPGGGFQVRVRGVGSISAGTAPLYIIDGVQVGTADVSTQAASNPLNSLNPNDIENIEILKDAAAVAIYGAQAANGVVLITTRRGRAGQTRFDISSQIGATSPIKTYDLLNGPEFVNAMIEAYENYYVTAGREVGFGRDQAIAAFGDPDSVSSYNWQDAIYRTGLSRQVNVSASGGGESTNFYLSGGADYQEGQVIMSDYNRLSLALNVDHRATRKLGLEARFRVASTEQFGTISDGNFTNGPFFAVGFLRPTESPFVALDPTDTAKNEACYRATELEEGCTYNLATTGGYNIVQGVNLEKRIGRTKQFAGNLGANYQFTQNLFLRGFAGLDFRNVRDRNYRPREIPAFSGTGGSAFEANREVLNWNANTTLSYLKTFNRIHNLSALVGGELRQEQRETFTASGTGFPTGLFQSLDQAAVPSAVSGFFTEYKTAGVFSQVKYDYNNKYFLTGSLRTDGSSRFGSDRRWGTFYSLSGAWDMAQESFFDFASSVDLFKLRASYGVTGNSAIDNFASRSLIGGGGSYIGQPGLRPSQLGNNLLTWEEASTANLGLDYSLFNNRISGSIDAYQRTNDNLLLDRPLPTDAGFSSISQNVGVVENRGLEFELSTINLRSGGFEWTSDFNISFQQNEVKELADGAENLGTSIRVGQPLSVYWVYKYAGVNPADGRSMWYDKDGNITYTPQEGDEIVGGKTIPDYWGGLNNALSYGGLRLDVFFQFSVGQSTFNQQQGFFLLDPARARGLERKILDRWQQPGDVTDTPRLFAVQTEPGSASNISSSTRFIEDVSYLRLKNITLSYALPQQVTNLAGVRSLNVFVQGQNLVTWTPYSGIDPELVGTQTAVYPQGKQVTAGFQLQF